MSTSSSDWLPPEPLFTAPYRGLDLPHLPPSASEPPQAMGFEAYLEWRDEMEEFFGSRKVEPRKTISGPRFEM